MSIDISDKEKAINAAFSDLFNTKLRLDLEFRVEMNKIQNTFLPGPEKDEKDYTEFDPDIIYILNKFRSIQRVSTYLLDRIYNEVCDKKEEKKWKQ